MKKLPLLLALAWLGACSNPTTTQDDTTKSGGTTQDLAGAPNGSADSSAATNVTGGGGARATDEAPTDQRPAEDPAQPGAAVTPDANFVNSVLADGQFEIQAAQRLLKDTKGSKLQQFAQQMVADHTKAGDELRKIAKALGMNVTDRLNREQTGILGQMEKLVGAPLQALYIKSAVSGHETAVSLFKTASQSAAKPELKQFAQKTLPIIEHHAMMAKALRDGKPMPAMKM